MVDFAIFVARDHADLERTLASLATASPGAVDAYHLVEGARLGFATHAEAQANVLHRALVHVPPTHAASRQLMKLLGEHHEQERLLLRLARTVPGSLAWTRLVRLLRSSLAAHHAYERTTVLPVVRDVAGAAAYDRLATAYATERLRALGMMSAVVVTPHRRRAETLT